MYFYQQLIKYHTVHGICLRHNIINFSLCSGNSKSSNDPTVSKKKGSSCCFSIRNLVAVKTIGDTEADDASVRDTETVDVSVSWNVLPSASHCNNQLESWNLTILRWNSTHDIPKHDYSIAESATAVVEVVPISCNSTNCVISHINLKKDKYYQFRLRISTSDRTDVYGSRIYYYGHEGMSIAILCSSTYE